MGWIVNVSLKRYCRLLGSLNLPDCKDMNAIDAKFQEWRQNYGIIVTGSFFFERTGQVKRDRVRSAYYFDFQRSSLQRIIYPIWAREIC